MKINHDYLKELLEAFQNSDQPTTDIEKLKERGFDYNSDEFIFHLQILYDRNLVERDDGDSGLGFFKSIDGFVSWSVLPLRLTANGHDFIEALNNKEVWSKIKSEFKDASVGTLISVSKQLLDGFLKKKVSEILDS